MIEHVRAVVPTLVVVAALAACATSASPPPTQVTPPLVFGAPAPSVAMSPRAVAASRTMRHVSEGSFQMGAADGADDEKPVHQVTVAAFDMDATEVTVAAYAACVKAGKCAPAPKTVQWSNVSERDHHIFDRHCNADLPDKQDHPINCVTWDMATAYCASIGKRLPTEEEWEYAARGKEERAYPWGNAPPSSKLLNACGAECAAETRDQTDAGGRSLYPDSDGWPYTAPVASFPEDALGLYDMSGNVFEWTASNYCSYETPACSDPRRVARGGSYYAVEATFVRTTDRDALDPMERNTNLGFRCAR